MQLLPFKILTESGVLVDCVVHAATITHLEQGPTGNLIVHVMSGRVIETTTIYEDFIRTMTGRPSSILTPVAR